MVTPSGLSTLTLSAAADAPQGGPFALTITATGRGISHTAQPSITINFGLVPLCFGAFTGVVTDTVSGSPIPTASVGLPGQFQQPVDANGQYTM
jgi:hypothetical protein